MEDPQGVSNGGEKVAHDLAVVRSMLTTHKNDMAIVSKFAKRLFIQNISLCDPVTNGIIAACADRITHLKATIAELETML